MAISSRPLLVATFKVGDTVYFDPFAMVKSAPALTRELILVKVVGVTYEYTKILYDLAFPMDDGHFYETRPAKRVDAVFVKPLSFWNVGKQP
jgi:hypothetical protein